jgi:glycosyltransferase involved in cell wall biosynthesis
MLDIGVIIPRLVEYGGAQRLVVECLARWQHRHRLTLYATDVDRGLLREHGVAVDRLPRVRLTPMFEGPHSGLLNGVMLPKLWEREIGHHQVYHGHQSLTRLIDRHPMVWYPHEPWRWLYDLRYDKSAEYRPPALQHISRRALGNTHTLADPFQEATRKIVAEMDGFGNPDRVVANSLQSARYLEDVFGGRVRDVVYPGVDVEEFVPTEADPDVVTVVGRLGHHKRLRLVLEAIHRVPGVQLYLAGQGPEQEALVRMAQALEIADRVYFLPGLTNREIQVLMARSLAVVFTPTREPFGIVALEAMAAARPLIAVQGGGYTEVVDETCAFIVPPEPGEIAERIQRLRADPDLARRMGAAGREMARQFSWDRTANELSAIIEETAREYRRSPVAAPHAPPSVPGPLVGVHFLCWYGDGYGGAHWQTSGREHGVTDMPALGYYGSAQGTTIEEQLRSLQEANFDFAVLHLHLGATDFEGQELLAVEHIFGIAERDRSPLRFAIQICPTADATSKSISDAIEFVCSLLARRAHYLRIDGRPALFFQWPEGHKLVPGWAGAILAASESFARIVGLAWDFPEDPELQGFLSECDGTYAVPPVLARSPGAWEEWWNKADTRDPGLRIMSLSPGYDDRHMPRSAVNSGSRWIDRLGGDNFRRGFKVALELTEAPDLFVIDSFNDYSTNTHIEKSQANGTLYLELAAEFIRTAKTRWASLQPAAA